MPPLPPRRLGEDRRDPGRRPAFHPLAAAFLGIGFATVAAPGPLALRSRREALALAAQFLQTLADHREIVGGAGAVHGGVSSRSGRPCRRVLPYLTPNPAAGQFLRRHWRALP